MGIRFGVLRGTKDIWCRDYMPVQMDDMSFVGYKFNPDYLKKNFGHSEYTEYENRYSPVGARFRPWERVSDPSKIDVRKLSNFSFRSEYYNDIVLDGGNLVFCGDYVILTDKILKENNNQSPDQLKAKLRKMFNYQFPAGREKNTCPGVWSRRRGFVAGSDPVLLRNQSGIN